MRTLLIATALAACGNRGAVECGKGTVLHNGTCEAVAAPIDARVASPDAAAVVVDAATDQISDKWGYTSSKDAMRGTVSEVAAVQSKNTITFKSPYGESHMVLMLQHAPPAAMQPGERAAIAVERGQFLCHPDGCTISTKIDDGKVATWSALPTADGHANVIFLGNVGDWERALAVGKHLVVEAPFYQNGLQQFEFDVSGLDWKYVAKPEAPVRAEPRFCFETKDRYYDDSTKKLVEKSKPWCRATREGCEGSRQAMGDADATECVETK